MHEKPPASAPADPLEKMLIESLVFGASNFPVTPFSIMLQNIKVTMQVTGQNIPDATLHLKQEGLKRLFSGYVPYTGKCVISSAIGGPALILSSSKIKEFDLPLPERICFTALTAGALETAFTAMSEGRELDATKNLPPDEGSRRQSFLATARRTSAIGPLILGRNSIFWLGSIGTSEISKDCSEPEIIARGALAGGISGIVSTPIDNALTKKFGTTDTIKSIIEQGDLFKGGAVRTVQIAGFTAASCAAISFLKTLEENAKNTEDKGRM